MVKKGSKYPLNLMFVLELLKKLFLEFIFIRNEKKPKKNGKN
jgi:hypothetical protein